MKALPTTYKGVTFRSRLEARWAIFWDTLGLPWEYEPEGYDTGAGMYLPDFRVQYPGRDHREIHYEWFEVKGDVNGISHAEWNKMQAFDQHHRLFLLDGPPAVKLYNTIGDCLERDWSKDENGLLEPGECKIPLRPSEGVFSNTRDGWSLWSGKGRMWWDCFENIEGEDYWFPPKYLLGVERARTKRFTR